MSETYASPGVIRSVASRLRGHGQSEEGDYMRPAEEAGQVEGSAHPPPIAQNHGLPTHAHTEASKGSVKPSWGSNATLPLVEVERALLGRIQDMAKTTGKQDVPVDIVDFIASSNVIFLDHNNQRVSFSRVVVTWEG